MRIRILCVGRMKDGPERELVDDYLTLVRQEMKGDAKSSQALLNILAELEELTAQTAYKLRFLK